MILEKNTTVIGYKIKKLLGQGMTGDVYEVVKKNLQLEDESYAMKFIDVPKMEQDFRYKLNETKSRELTNEYFKNEAIKVSNEVGKLMEFTNDIKTKNNFVNFIEYKIEEVENNKGHFKIILIMELLTPLDSYILMHSMKADDIFKIAFSVLNGLKEMHNQNLIHRDIKLENIFVDKKDNKILYKIGDLGGVKRVTKSMNISRYGTEFYMDPYEYDCVNKPQIDIYSASMMLYKLMNNNRFPFSNEEDIDERTFISKLNNCDIPLPINAQNDFGKIIIKGLLNPQERYKNVQEMIDELEKVYQDYKDNNVDYLNKVVIEVYEEEEESTITEETNKISETNYAFDYKEDKDNDDTNSLGLNINSKPKSNTASFNDVSHLYKNKKFILGIWKYVLLVISLGLGAFCIDLLKNDVLITNINFINTKLFRIGILIISIGLFIFCGIKIILDPSRNKRKLIDHSKQFKNISIKIINEIKIFYDNIDNLNEKVKSDLINIKNNILNINDKQSANNKNCLNEDKILGYLCNLNEKLNSQEINLDEDIYNDGEKVQKIIKTVAVRSYYDEINKLLKEL